MVENSELIEWSTKLSTLKEKGLISAIEHQKIASSGHFVERELLKLLVSKYPLQGANIWKIFKVLAAEIPASVTAENNSSLQNKRENEQDFNPLHGTSRNPLLNNTVVLSVFQFLTFDEVKQCRLVCHQWDFTAQPLLRRKGIIHFKPISLQPSTFLEAFKDKLQDLPFTSFKFSNEGSQLRWSSSQVQTFFDKWGKNVKHLELMNVSLEVLRPENAYIEYKLRHLRDVTPWLEKTTNLTKLKIEIDYACNKKRGQERHPTITPLQVELDTLKSVKYLHLYGCNISVKKNMMTPLRPLEINLNQVHFTEPKGGAIKTPINLHEHIDFKEATNIFLTPHTSYPPYRTLILLSLPNFSLVSPELKTDKVHFNNMQILNWNDAKGKIDSLSLCGMTLIERNELEIKKFVLNSCTIDMTIVPLSIQQMRFEEGTKIICDHSVVFPELVFLGFKYITRNTLDMLSRFTACKNLVEIEIEQVSHNNYTTSPFILKLSMIPKSVKRMKIQGSIKFLDNRLHILDKLIIQRNNVKPDFFTYVTTLLSNALQLKVKVLVMNLSHTNFGVYWDTVENFVNLNQQRFEKIVLGDLQRVNKFKPFEQSSFSRRVDSKSDYYEFQTKDPIGKAISSSEFNSWCTLENSFADPLI